jgi:hypothetical protein
VPRAYIIFSLFLTWIFNSSKKNNLAGKVTWNTTAQKHIFVVELKFSNLPNLSGNFCWYGLNDIQNPSLTSILCYNKYIFQCWDLVNFFYINIECMEVLRCHLGDFVVYSMCDDRIQISASYWHVLQSF